MKRSGLFSTTIGRKILIGVTGMALFAYLLLHIAGNLLFFLGPETYNNYSHFLVSNPLIYVFEIGLAAIFLLHIYLTVTMWFESRKARPVPYHNKKRAGGTSRKTVASSTMIYTGLFTLLFVIVHLQGFKFGTEYVVFQSGVAVRDLYRLEVEQFSNPAIVAFYVVSMAILAFHLWHGLWSASQSLGVDNATQSRRLFRAGKTVALILMGAFAFIPLYVYFVGGRP